MKGLLILVLCILWLLGLYYGYTLIVSKTMKSAPEPEKSADQARQEMEQRQKIQDSLQQQRELMKDRQRTMRNYQNR